MPPCPRLGWERIFSDHTIPYEIIDELEPTKRSVHMGSVGYLRFDDRVYFQVGSGMVHDSEPEAEYRKTLHKARALFQALNLSPHVEAST